MYELSKKFTLSKFIYFEIFFFMNIIIYNNPIRY